MSEIDKEMTSETFKAGKIILEEALKLLRKKREDREKYYTSKNLSDQEKTEIENARESLTGTDKDREELYEKYDIDDETKQKIETVLEEKFEERSDGEERSDDSEERESGSEEKPNDKENNSPEINPERISEMKAHISELEKQRDEIFVQINEMNSKENIFNETDIVIKNKKDALIETGRNITNDIANEYSNYTKALAMKELNINENYDSQNIEVRTKIDNLAKEKADNISISIDKKNTLNKLNWDITRDNFEMDFIKGMSDKDLKDCLNNFTKMSNSYESIFRANGQNELADALAKDRAEKEEVLLNINRETRGERANLKDLNDAIKENKLDLSNSVNHQSAISISSAIKNNIRVYANKAAKVLDYSMHKDLELGRFLSRGGYGLGHLAINAGKNALTAIANLGIHSKNGLSILGAGIANFCIGKAQTTYLSLKMMLNNRTISKLSNVINSYTGRSDAVTNAYLNKLQGRVNGLIKENAIMYQNQQNLFKLNPKLTTLKDYVQINSFTPYDIKRVGREVDKELEKDVKISIDEKIKDKEFKLNNYVFDKMHYGDILEKHNKKLNEIIKNIPDDMQKGNFEFRGRQYEFEKDGNGIKIRAELELSKNDKKDLANFYSKQIEGPEFANNFGSLEFDTQLVGTIDKNGNFTKSNIDERRKDWEERNNEWEKTDIRKDKEDIDFDFGDR